MLVAEELLGERLRALETRPRGGGTEGAEPCRREAVDEPHRERELRADDGEIGMEAIGEFDDGVEIFDIQRQALGFLRDASIAWRAGHFADARRLQQLPNQGVLASASTQHQNFAGHSETYRVGCEFAGCQRAELRSGQQLQCNSLLALRCRYAPAFGRVEGNSFVVLSARLKSCPDT